MKSVGTMVEPEALEVEQPMLGALQPTNPVAQLAEVQFVELTEAIGTIQDEAFMTLLMAINDTRKRILILSLLSFLAMC